MQKITYVTNKLQHVDLVSPLETLLSELKQYPRFLQFATGRLRIEADALAKKVAAKQAEHSSYLLGRPESSRAATLHMTDTHSDRFDTLLQEIYQTMKKQFENEATRAGMTPEQAINSLLTTLQNLQKLANHGAGFASSFKLQKDLKRKRVHFSTNQLPPDGSDPILRLSRLRLTIDGLAQFQQQLKTSLNEACRLEQCLKECADQEQAEELAQDLSDLLSQVSNESSSELIMLQQIIELDAIGQMKKMAILKYLDFLDFQLEKKYITLDKADTQLRPHLQTLIYRLNQLETFIWKYKTDDGFYSVNFGIFSCNLRDLFARADALNKLPIIPLVEGALGETFSKDQGENSFLFGLKLKMGGSVPSSSQKQTIEQQKTPTVLQYYMNLLDPKQEVHQEAFNSLNVQSFIDKIMLVLVSYYFVFWKLDDPTFDPIQYVENDILKVLKYGTIEQQTSLLTKIAQTLQTDTSVQQMITGLQTLFRKMLRHKKASFQYQRYDLHLRVRRGILNRELKNMVEEQSFFQSNILKGDHKQALKYIQVEEATGISAQTLCKLDAQITIDDILFYPSAQPIEQFDLSYIVDDTPVLPILFAPSTNTASLAYLIYFQKHNIISIPYGFQKGKTKEEIKHIQQSWQSSTGFTYRLAFALLTFLSLSLLASYVPQPPNANQRLFIPFLRLHISPEKSTTPQETFLQSLSQLLAHLFSTSYRADQQGLYIGDLITHMDNFLKKTCLTVEQVKYNANKTKYALQGLPSQINYRFLNAISSLYGRLPRICLLPEPLPSANGTYTPLEKLAIVVVSSRESDTPSGRESHDYRLLTLFGEAITIDRLNSQEVRIVSHRTFIANTDSEKAYTAPTVLADLIDELYQLGYTHILYVAHSPHTERLRIAATTEDDDKRYFMSQKVLRTMMAERKDLIIYPIFFDLYYVSQIIKPQVSALYIQDTHELTNLMQDPSQRIVTFFHLFNGQTIDDPQNKKYNGVMAYSTFWNFYDDIVANQDIHRGLLYDKDIHPSLKDDILTYLTLFHFTRCEKSVGPITLKLNPYGDIIGNESVGTKATMPFHPSSIDFNLLALLTRAQSVIEGTKICSTSSKKESR